MTPKKLWRVTATMWFDEDPNDVELGTLARECETGSGFCSACETVVITNSNQFPDTEFFDDLEPDDADAATAQCIDPDCLLHHDEYHGHLDGRMPINAENVGIGDEVLIEQGSNAGRFFKVLGIKLIEKSDSPKTILPQFQFQTGESGFVGALPRQTVIVKTNRPGHRDTHVEAALEHQESLYCPTCREEDHAACSLTPGCPCCDDTLRKMAEDRR